MAKFTDNQLARLYLSLHRDYLELREQTLPPLTPHQIHQKLVDRVMFAFHAPESVLYCVPLAVHESEIVSNEVEFEPGKLEVISRGASEIALVDSEPKYLDVGEWDKVLQVLNFFLSTCPTYAPLPEGDRRALFTYTIKKVDINSDRWLEYFASFFCYCSREDAAFTWSRLSLLTTHRHALPRDSRKRETVLAVLLFIVLAVLIVPLFFVALYYLLRQAYENLGRGWYNEGRLQAAVVVAGALAAGYLTYFVATLFAASPLTDLIVFAGVTTNPASLVLIAMVCLSIIIAAASCFFTSTIQQYVLRKINPEALDPEDPSRYALTPEEEQLLVEKGFDPIKVKCTIVALHAEISSRKSQPLLLGLFSPKGPAVQEPLGIIRRLRQGEIAPENAPARNEEYDKDFLNWRKREILLGGVAVDLAPFPYASTQVGEQFYPNDQLLGQEQKGSLAELT